MVRSSAGADAGIEIGGEILARQADDEALEVGQIAGRERERRLARGGGVERIVPAHDAEHRGGVGDVVAEDRDAVERRAEGDQPVAADPAVGRLDADDAAEAGGLAHRAAGLGAERGGHDAGGHQRRRSADEPPGTRA